MTSKQLAECKSRLCSVLVAPHYPSFFFFNDTATTEIYTLSLHDALPIWSVLTDHPELYDSLSFSWGHIHRNGSLERDRKSTRLNSSHANISYAVFCLKKKTLQRNRAEQCIPSVSSTHPGNRGSSDCLGRS